ncbi:MAG: lysine--tRNA ligase [Cryobacterium sp.]|nr:lysine--tRNA ligase [Oligoflexia bacterium]
MSENSNSQVPGAGSLSENPVNRQGDLSHLPEQVRVRYEKMQRIRDRNENPYKNGFKPADLAADLHRLYDEKTKEELDPLKIRASIGGRAIAVRDFGKAAFLRLRDRTGPIQIYVAKDSLGEDGYRAYKEDFDVGDIAYVEGVLFKTKTNELSIHADKLVLLTKSLQPLPEKFHGMTDIEKRYRQRYVDLIVTEESRETFRKRAVIVDEVRQFFKDHDFMEVETPMLHGIAGGAAARPFTTHHNTLDMELYLRIAPELYLKRLVVGGFERVFEINRNFRNEGTSIKHNPEFTMLEFYMTYATFDDLMDLTEKLFQRIALKLSGGTKITYQGTEIEMGRRWERITVEESILKHSKFTQKEKIRDRATLLAYGAANGIHMEAKAPVGNLIMAIFDAEVEEKLIQPTYVTHYPTEVSPLSRLNEVDPFVVDRFELFIYGREMGNAFSELNDPVDQRNRFLGQMEAKEGGDLEAHNHDEDYCVALEYGMPPTAGEGIGIDRLAMLFTDSASIRDVILFPQMRKLAE